MDRTGWPGVAPSSWAITLGRNSVPILLLGGLALVMAALPLPWAALASLGTLAALLVVARPELGLVLVAFAVPFGGLVEVEMASLSLGGVEAAVGLLTLGFILSRLASRHPLARPPWLTWPLVFFLAVLVALLTTATKLVPATKEVVKWAELGLVFVVGSHLLRGERPSAGSRQRRLALVLGSLLAAGTAQGLLGWYQTLSAAGPAGFLLGGGVLRAYGSFGQPNPYAGYLGLGLPLGLGLLLYFPRPLWRTPWPWVVALSLLVMGAALLFSFSRGAWLAVATAVTIMTVVWRPRLLPLALALGGGGIGFVLLGGLELLPSAVAERLTVLIQYFGLFDVRQVGLTPENYPIFERMVNWQAAWDIFLDHPWLGAGLGDFAGVFPDYALKGWQNLTGHAHNYYLNLLAEGGMIGLGAYLLFLAAALVYLGQSAIGGRRRGRPGVPFLARAAALGALGAIVALTGHNLFDNLYVHGMSAQAGLLLALAGAPADEEEG